MVIVNSYGMDRKGVEMFKYQSDRLLFEIPCTNLPVSASISNKLHLHANTIANFPIYLKTSNSPTYEVCLTG